jgi:hypothetical protein
LYIECVTKEAVEGFGDLNIGGQIINSVKYADGLVLLAREEMVLWDMLEKKQPYPVKVIIDQKQLENVESFKYLGSMLTNYGRCTCEIKSRIAMAKAAFKRRGLFLQAKWTWN